MGCRAERGGHDGGGAETDALGYGRLGVWTPWDRDALGYGIADVPTVAMLMALARVVGAVPTIRPEEKVPAIASLRRGTRRA